MSAELTCDKMFNQRRRRKSTFRRDLSYLVGFSREDEELMNSLMLTNRTEVETVDGFNLKIRDGDTW